MHIVAKMTKSIGQVGPAIQAQSTDDSIAESSQGLGSVAGTNLGSIFAHGEIADIVGAVLNRLVPTPELFNLGEGGRLVVKGSDAKMDILRDSLRA